MLLNMVASVFLGDVGVIGCTLKVMVPIKQLWLCGCNWSSNIITLHIMDYLYFLAKVSHTIRVLFATLDTIVQVQCDLTITINSCGSMCSLNYLKLFLKIKLVRLV